MNEEEFKKSLGSAVDSIISNGRDHRRKEPRFVELKEHMKDASSGIGISTRHLDYLSLERTMDVITIIEDQGGKVSDEAYDFIISLPLYIQRLKQEIIKTEGHVCSSDKAYNRADAKLKKLVGL